MGVHGSRLPSRMGVGAAAVLTIATLTLVGVPAAAAKGPRVKAPGPPTNVTVLDQGTALLVSWQAPGSDGGSPITGYTATATHSPHTSTCSTTGATSCTIHGIVVSSKGSIVVRAENAAGLGKKSASVSTSESGGCSYLGAGVDLEACDLAGADLADGDLDDANLDDVSLTDANLNGTNLAGANLSDVFSGGITGTPGALPGSWSLIDGYLVGPDADLTEADLANTTLTGVDLSGADLDLATLTGVISGGITGTPVNLPTRWSLIGGYLVGPGADLAQASLTNTNLSGADLSGADLASADLSQTDLTTANLTGVDLSNAVITDADVTDANLTSATLTGVTSGGITGTPSSLPSDWLLTDGYLVGPDVDLANADLDGADLTEADLANVDLSGASLSGVASGGITGTPSGLPTDWELIGGYLLGPSANLTNADLSDFDLNNVDLASATLTGVASGGVTGTPAALPATWTLMTGYLIGPGANLSNADLAGVDLQGLDLAAANLNSADLAGADLTDADLDGAFFDGTDVGGVNVEGANFSSAILAGVISGQITGNPSALPTDWTLTGGYLVGPDSDLAGDNLESANLVDVDLLGANLGGTELQGANLTDATLTNAYVQGANLNDATLTGVTSGGIMGVATSLPASWTLTSGYLIGPGTSYADGRLADADLVGVDFAGDSLTDAILYGSDMADADLDGADLTGANLDGVDLTGDDLNAVTWSNTTCPDGTNSNSDSGTCVNDEAIDPSNVDLDAQSNLVHAYASATSYFEQYGTLSGLTPADLEASNPSLTFTTQYSTGATDISLAISTDGNGVVLAAYTNSDERCWYLIDNENSVSTVADLPWGSTPTASPIESFFPMSIVFPAYQGTVYAEDKGDPRSSDCDAAQPVAGTETIYGFGSLSFPAI